jgi:Macrocin-O-methyltransferase (TylF)
MMLIQELVRRQSIILLQKAPISISTKVTFRQRARGTDEEALCVRTPRSGLVRANSFRIGVLYDRLSPGAMVVVHDYNAWFAARQAVDEFFSHKPEVPLPMPDRSGSVVIVKQ